MENNSRMIDVNRHWKHRLYDHSWILEYTSNKVDTWNVHAILTIAPTNFGMVLVDIFWNKNGHGEINSENTSKTGLSFQFNYFQNI